MEGHSQANAGRPPVKFGDHPRCLAGARGGEWRRPFGEPRDEIQPPTLNRDKRPGGERGHGQSGDSGAH